MNFDIMYPGIVAFILVLIGVVLTVIEFKKMEREKQQEKKAEAEQPRKRSQK